MVTIPEISVSGTGGEYNWEEPFMTEYRKLENNTYFICHLHIDGWAILCGLKTTNDYGTGIFTRYSERESLQLITIHQGGIVKSVFNGGIPAFYKNYASLSALGTALGTAIDYRSGNFNSLTTIGSIYYVGAGSFISSGAITNAPAAEAGVLYVLTGTATDYRTQVYISLGKIYTRRLDTGSIYTTDWKMFLGTDVS